MDKEAFINFVIWNQPVYAKYSVYKKIDDTWYQSDITMLKEKNNNIYRGPIIPPKEFGSDGDVYLHMDKPIIYFSKNKVSDTMSITYENFNGNIGLQHYSISLDSINTHAYTPKNVKFFETIISTKDIHICVKNSDTINILCSDCSTKTVFRLPPEATPVLYPK